MRLEINKIRLDGGTQPRAELRYDVIDDYAEEMRQGVIFPAVTVFFDGSDYWLADGFHRVHAARRAGQGAIDADVRQGTRRDAVLYSVGVNAEHGLRRTNDDKRRAVMTLLQDEEWRQWSDYKIAEACHVSRSLVQSMRSSLALKTSEKTYITKHGTTATMDTSNIGKSQPLEDDATITRAQRLVDGAATRRAKALASMLATMPPEVVEVVERYGVDDLWTVQELARWAREAKDTFEEVRRAGYIQPGDEHEAVCITDTPARIKWAMGLKHNGHALIGGMANDQRDAIWLSSESNEWYTPAKYVEAARRVMGGIDTDPATNAIANRTINATAIYTREDDGLQQEWHGRVWLNPPYGGLSGPFIAKLVEEYEAGRVTEAVVLVNANSTETKWFAPMWQHTLCFTDHRIDFISPHGVKDGSTHGSVFIYLGPNVNRFVEEFDQFGYVVRQVKYMEKSK